MSENSKNYRNRSFHPAKTPQHQTNISNTFLFYFKKINNNNSKKPHSVKYFSQGGSSQMKIVLLESIRSILGI